MDSVYYGLCGCVDFAILFVLITCCILLILWWIAWLLWFMVGYMLLGWLSLLLGFVWFAGGFGWCLSGLLFGLRGLSGGRYCWLGWFEMGLLLRFGCFLVCILLLLFVML